MRTKIIATLGPASMEYETMKVLAQHGVRVFRLNFSHSDAAFFEPVVRNIRRLESDLGIPLTALGDLCGPKVRIGDVQGSPLQVERGCLVYLGLPEMESKAEGCAFISLDIPELLVGLESGMPVSLSDGMLQFTITQTAVPNKLYVMEALNDGILTSHKGIAFPGKFHPMPALTAKDRKDLREGLEIGLDAVAVSFVQHEQDILDAKDEIKKHGTWIPVIAKLERKNALDRLEPILEVTDAVMVARGDLGLECSMAELPVIQKRVLRACRHAQKASIVATQMLLSMVKNPVPTRAEATDVANAIMDGADCVMLSEETAVGKYPDRVVRFINEISMSAEEYFLERIQGPYVPKKEKNPVKYLAYAAALLAESADSKAIISHSGSGSTVRFLSSRRPAAPIYCLTPDERVLHYMNFFWGVNPRPADLSIERHMARVERFVQENPAFVRGDNVVLTSGQPTPGQGEQHTNALKIYYK